MTTLERSPQSSPNESSSSGALAIVASNSRPALKRVRILLPVWGYKYVRRFLEVALPTWLAPGNLAALAAAPDCEMVIMTTLEDEEFLVSHPAFRRLNEMCRVRLQFIDHLVTGDNYSTTITLAYTQGVRSLGADALDTCFFFLVSDYIVADGSFANVLKRIQNGANAVLAGNFQVSEEDAEPWLQERLSQSPEVLSLSARELVRWGMAHRHPTTLANTVNYPFAHNKHTNRLFWQVDSDTMIGRFYLIHMVAIRPERVDFTIGSACDYSFVPEMVPSNNVEVISDSDEYLTVEAQPRGHESAFLSPRKQSIGALATSLAEWTTARHRENAKTTVIFHARELPTEFEAVKSEADEFIKRVAWNLPSKPHPHTGHPYWLGAIASMHESTGVKLDERERRLVLGITTGHLINTFRERLVRTVARSLIGKPPFVHPWHVRFLDYELVLRQLHRYASDKRARLLMISAGPTAFTTAFNDGGERVVRLKLPVVLGRSPELFAPFAKTFDCCLIEIAEHQFDELGKVIDRVAPMMKKGGRILISCYNRRETIEGTEFARSIAYHASRLVRPGAMVAESHFVPSSGFRWTTYRAVHSTAVLARRRPVIGFPLLFVIGPFLLIASLISNLVARSDSRLVPHRLISSFLAVLNVDPDLAEENAEYSADYIRRKRERARRGLPPVRTIDPRLHIPTTAPDTKAILEPAASGDPLPTIAQQVLPVTTTTPSTSSDQQGESTREKQYNRTLDLRDRYGLTSLGLMTNQVWEDDPRRLTFLLARYKFVSKMLQGKKIVGEVGCGDAFGTRIVMQSVDRVVAYDFDPVFIQDIKERRSETWPVEAHYHDMLENPLPNQHDGIYSLDVIEHILPSDEDRFITNLASSLTEDGVLIIGSPSLESQTYASPPSKEGHVNCKSGEQLRALMKQYFHNVFLFSMNDEVVHTGFSPMAHYLFAICVQKKTGSS